MGKLNWTDVVVYLCSLRDCNNGGHCSATLSQIHQKQIPLIG